MQATKSTKSGLVDPVGFDFWRIDGQSYQALFIAVKMYLCTLANRDRFHFLPDYVTSRVVVGFDAQSCQNQDE